MVWLKGRAIAGLRIALTLLALWFLLRQVGGQDLRAALRGTRTTLLAGAWMLFLFGIVVRVLRWRALLRGLGLHPPFALLLKLYLVGGFFNSFLPSGLGAMSCGCSSWGETLRAARQRWVPFLSTV